MPKVVNDDGDVRGAQRCLGFVSLAEGGGDQEINSHERLEMNSHERLDINSHERLEMNNPVLSAKNS